MTDDAFGTLDQRFEEELRAVLRAQVPTDVPQSLRSFVAAVPRREGSLRVAHPFLTRFAALATAAVVLVAAVAGGLFLLSTKAPTTPIGSPSPRATQSPSAARSPTAAPSPTPAPSPSPWVAPATLRFVVNSGAQDPTSQQLQATVDALTERMSAWTSSPSQDLAVTTDGVRSVTVRLGLTWEGWQDLPNISSALAAVGDVEFTPIDAATVDPAATIDPSLPALFSGTAVEWPAYLNVDELGQVSLRIQVDSTADQALSAWSAAHVGSTLAVTVDGNLLAAPVVGGPITNGSLLISMPTLSGNQTSTARFLEAMLQSKPLPFSLTPSSALPTPPAGLFQPGYFQFRVESGDHVLTADENKSIADLVTRRVEAAGETVGSSDVVFTDPDRGLLSVTLRRINQDYSWVTTTIAATGEVDFVPLITGAQLPQPGQTIDPALPRMFSNHDGSPSYGTGTTWGNNDGGPIITVGADLNAAATATFDVWARANLDGTIAVVVDGTIAAEALVRDQHVEGQITFTFFSDSEAAQRLAGFLATGPLPYPLTLLTQPESSPAN